MEKEKRFINLLAEPAGILGISLLWLILCFFLGNFILHFFQQTGLAIIAFAENASFHFSVDWRSFFIFQLSKYPLYYAGFYLVIGYGLVKFIYNMRLSYRSLNHGQKGTSSFENPKELKKQYHVIPAKDKEYEGGAGVIVSALREKGKPYRLLIDKGPNHTMCIGITRSGKGETFVVPMIDVISRAKKKESLVINDPKGELAGASYAILKKRGYEVYVFNLIQQMLSIGFNPLQLVIDAYKKNNPSQAQQYANSVAYSLYHNPNVKDPFWQNSAKSLVIAIILAITSDAIKRGDENKINMYSVANFLSTLGSDTDEDGNNALDLFFQSRKDSDPAKMMYATSNFSKGNTRSSIFSTAMEKLQIFTLEPNAKLTSYNSLDLTSVGFGEKPVAIFLATPDFDASNHVLASIFVSQLYRVNAEKATMGENGKMKRIVHFLLDEVGNMPPIEGLPGMVTVGAGRGFRFHLIVQSYAQMKKMYGEDAETIIGNCSNQIYILTQDKGTAEQFSALIGTKTITEVGRNGKAFSFEKSESESTSERALLKPDELMKLKEGESVIVRANKRKDLKGRKIQPKPIFNTGAMSAKFRWEYLADQFDTSRSLQTLPIHSKTYHDMNLEEMVYTYKGTQQQYVKLKDMLGHTELVQLVDRLRKIFISSDEHVADMSIISEWTLQQLLSYLTYSDFQLPHQMCIQMIGSFTKYLPPSIVEKWKEILLESQPISEDDEWRERAIGTAGKGEEK